MTSTRFLLFIVTCCLLHAARAQQPLATCPSFRIDSLPARGVLLDKGWKFHAGDNPAWANADFDDSRWQGIDPTKNIFELLQIRKTGQIYWLRLRLSLDSALHQQLAMQLYQSGASEIYLNGQSIHEFGVINPNPAQIEAFTPNGSLLSFPRSASPVQVLAVRYALQPHIRYGQHFGTQNPALSIQLNTVEQGIAVINQQMLPDRSSNLVVGALSILTILFLAFFLFFPSRKESLYFAIYALGQAISWSIFFRTHLPIPVGELFLRNNVFLVIQTISYLFLLQSVYTTLAHKRGWLFWGLMLLGMVAIWCGIYIYSWGWYVFAIGVTTFVNLDATRVALVRGRKNQKGAWIIVAGGCVYLVCWLFFQLIDLNYLPPDLRGNFFLVSYLSIPVSFAIFFGYDFGLINRILVQKLMEVETLSSEKQQILTTQNEKLEQQVTERTVELAGKNRDLEIESALDKIRSASLAMRHSHELQNVVGVLLEKLKELGLVFDSGAAIHIFTEGSRDTEIWVATSDQLAPTSQVKLPNDPVAFEDNPIILDVWNAHETGNDIVNKVYSFEEKNRYFTYVFKHNSYDTIPEFVQNTILKVEGYTASYVSEKHSLLGAASWSGQTFSEMEFNILKRIARVFEQAYVRFLDLQKAEAQAREAQVEVALERVRSRTMAMQHSDELQDAAMLLFQQVQTLGVLPFVCGFNIWDEDKKAARAWMAREDGIEPQFKTSSKEDIYLPIHEAAQRGESLFVREQSGDELETHYRYLTSIPEVKSMSEEMAKAGISWPSFQIMHCAFFSQGYLMFITYEPVPEAWDIFKRFATVFEQTYTRFLDLQNKETQALNLAIEKKRLEQTLTELRTTQAQLIQKEKLASLGQLTAGIAHEIQNPLNFVNNFSEVSAELVAELGEEQQKSDRDPELEAELLGDLKQNLQKISHHGHRASSIVKGMLEHSRTTTGERQPTDLNALADEYLQLAYQGLRAKDKTFNAELVIDFAPNLGKVEVVPPEIGRVLLNLFNNAFYAVSQRAKTAESGPAGYVPTVWVRTRRVGRGVEVQVRDNGTGIAESVKAKIFQPFFTTKPTGEGTGLGLSLSYDIVTKGHGGTLSVASVEGEGTTFVIALPSFIEAD